MKFLGGLLLGVILISALVVYADATLGGVFIMGAVAGLVVRWGVLRLAFQLFRRRPAGSKLASSTRRRSRLTPASPEVPPAERRTRYNSRKPMLTSVEKQVVSALMTVLGVELAQASAAALAASENHPGLSFDELYRVAVAIVRAEREREFLATEGAA